MRALGDDGRGRGRPHPATPSDDYEIVARHEDDLAKTVFRVDATQGTTMRLQKTVAYHSSRGVPVRELSDRCDRTLDRAAPARPRPLRRRPARLVRRLLGGGRRRDRRRHPRAASRPAGHPLQPLHAGPGQRPHRRARRTREGRDRLGLRGPLLLGHRDLRDPVPHLHPARGGPQRAALPLGDAAGRARAGPRDGPERRDVPVAHHQRRGGLGVLRRRLRTGAHRRRHRLRADEVRPGHRRRGLPGPRGHRHPRRDRPDVGRPGLLAQQRRRRPSTSTASPARTSTRRSSTTTSSPT